MKRAAILALTMLLGLNACKGLPTTSGSEIPEVESHKIFLTDPSKYAAVRTLDGDRYSAVGALMTPDASVLGSAVLVHPKAILTAAHCFGDPTRRPLWFYTQSGQIVMIERVIIHPAYYASGVENDIAICILADKCYEPPVELMKRSSDLSMNEPLTTVGWSLGYKKVSQPNIMRYYGSLVEDHGSILRILAMNGSVYFGDSGGAVFEDTGKLCGIIDFLRRDADTGAILDNGAARIDFHYQWINEVLCWYLPDSWPWFEGD